MILSQSVLRSLPTILPIIFLQSISYAAAPAVPNAGSLLQQVKPVAPPAVSSPAEPSVSIQRGAGEALPSSDPFLVKAIRIVGNTLFDTASLHALVAEAEGKTLTLPQLDERAARVTAYYHARGYPLAQAMILAQVIEGGVLVIDVIEARYGSITLNNVSRVRGALFRPSLASLQRGQPIEESALNHALSLLSEIPGVVVSATLKPGEAVGTSDLRVDADKGPGVVGSTTLDNHGDRSTGKVRLSGSVNFLNPLHSGDVLSVSGLTSGRGTNYGRIGYDLLATGQGTRVGAAYSTLHYMLGEPFTVLDAHGTAISKSAWLKTPFRRSSHLNLYGQVHYDALRLQDRIDAGWVRTDRHLSNTTLSFSGDTRDAVLGGGISGWNLGWKTGQLKFDNTHARMADAATAGTEGQFSKWNLYVYRLQGLGPKSGLFLAFAGQWTKANLDSSEKLIAGGPLTVRAYDVGAWSGDQGYIATAELRRDLGFARRSQWQGIAFIDHAELTLSHAPWVTGSNRVALTGVGVGVNCAVAANWSARISVAARIGSTSMAPTNAASARVWFEVGRTF